MSVELWADRAMAEGTAPGQDRWAAETKLFYGSRCGWWPVALRGPASLNVPADLAPGLGQYGGHGQRVPSGLELGYRHVAVHSTRSSILAWRIPWTEETDGLQSMGSQKVLHDRATNRNTFTFM